MRRLVSIFFLTVFSFSMLSFSVEFHYCKGELKSFAIFGHAEDCGTCKSGDKHPPGCPMHKKEGKKKSCCENKVISHKGLEDVVKSTLDFSFDQPLQLVTIPVGLALNLAPAETEKKLFRKEYSPPDLHFDHQVLFQTFLI